ncbi:carboxylesterase/lipase family protein [Rhodococcus rhodnii]|uniref:Carboxylic ester hydrolase n=2 Tax=Rhodococcus rhodnii TaxID=38312 RepID=R7WUK1_9NOCA|nr:carboxylesterase/lipase family protein [Rhodococcus rhodnii]EOM77799.1 putative carboxylesterase [Rhodococcus rhodnii LMG 5362]TXG92204.1 carboxylesterase/lipase family protein [Rhodococcus rhodnii]
MSSLQIAVDGGVVSGRRIGGLRTWRGVPYAAPPAGELRFRAPHPVTPWQGVRPAHRFAARPAQPRGGGSEDCLHLDVVAPVAPSGELRPVMVYIHGGAYESGASSNAMYHGTGLVKRGDVVYVSVGYRLGALGYLDFSQFSTPDRTFESNLGLRDQIAALEWVQRNIAAFGGDPANVTLFGESAGANAVTTLMTVPRARGLFTRAIAQSPPAASTYLPERAARWAREFVEIGATDDPATWLAAAPPEELVAAGSELTARSLTAEPGVRPYAPTVDGDLLPSPALEAFEAGRSHPVPFLVGTNSHEGRVFPRFLDILPTSPERITHLFSRFDADLFDRVVGAYPGYPHRHAAADLGGDVTFWEPAIRCARGHAAHSPTYVYRYDYAPALLHAAGLSATHTLELYAVFGHHPWWTRVFTAGGARDALTRVTEVVQGHWLAFARDGEPENSWPRYELADPATYVIDRQPRVEIGLDEAKRLAWLGYEHLR